ncbi:response regulator [Leeuwenhoekiella sp. MAR_2009_132]|uniref:response regulator n=1 Tax=Leeuwenhoekiella sp. MAR_2009_132 TaxID=1392489 RepID=UPI0004915DDB|nr:response regulator [Leeuwenhoekiella sp. MAR_2009_132]
MYSKHILSIEDNKTDVALMKRIFSKHVPDYEITYISDGEEAVSYLESNTFKKALPKLILLDMKVPRVDGLELLRKIRSHEEYLHIPVVMLSSSDLPNDIKEAYEIGANSFVEKPKNYVDLCKALPVLIQYWIVYNK